MKQVKRNKRKVWRKTYGRPFITRRALCIARMAMTAAQGAAHISAINNTLTGVALRAVYCAKAVVGTAKAMNDASHEMNKGFVAKVSK